MKHNAFSNRFASMQSAKNNAKNDLKLINSGINTLEIASPFVNANRFINNSAATTTMVNKNAINGFDLTTKKI